MAVKFPTFIDGIINCPFLKSLHLLGLKHFSKGHSQSCGALPSFHRMDQHHSGIDLATLPTRPSKRPYIEIDPMGDKENVYDTSQQDKATNHYYASSVQKTHPKEIMNSSSRSALKTISNISNSKIKITIQKNEKLKNDKCKLTNALTATSSSPQDAFVIEGFSKSIESVQYDQDTFDFLMLQQNRYSPSIPKWIANENSEITPKMRVILIDWLSEVVEDFELSTETFHLTVNYIDRYLNIKTVPKPHLQLLGVAALLLASKFEELKPCKIKDLVDICNNCYTYDQLYKMERKLITELDFGLLVATSSSFAYLEVKKYRPNHTTVLLMDYLLELCLSNISMLSFTYYDISIAVLYILHQYGFESLVLDKTLQVNFSIVNMIISMLSESYLSSVKGIATKYSSQKYEYIASRIYDKLLNHI